MTKHFFLLNIRLRYIFFREDVTYPKERKSSVKSNDDSQKTISCRGWEMNLLANHQSNLRKLREFECDMNIFSGFLNNLNLEMFSWIWAVYELRKPSLTTLHRKKIASPQTRESGKTYQPFLYFYRLNGQCTTQTPTHNSPLLTFVRRLNWKKTSTAVCKMLESKLEEKFCDVKRASMKSVLHKRQTQNVCVWVLKNK
jgi:hypothetical protein